MTGGGIYVEGNANSVVLSTANPTISGTVHNQQVFTITQGSVDGHDDHGHRRSHEQYDDNGLADRFRCDDDNHDQRRA